MVGWGIYEFYRQKAEALAAAERGEEPKPAERQVPDLMDVYRKAREQFDRGRLLLMSQLSGNSVAAAKADDGAEQDKQRAHSRIRIPPAPFNGNVEPLEPGCLDDEPDAHAPPASPEMT